MSKIQFKVRVTVELDDGVVQEQLGLQEITGDLLKEELVAPRPELFSREGWVDLARYNRGQERQKAFVEMLSSNMAYALTQAIYKKFGA